MSNVLGWVKYAASLYWNGLLEMPLRLFESLTGMPITSGLAMIVKAVITLVLLYLIYSSTSRMRRRIQKFMGRDKEALYDKADAAALKAYDEAARSGGGPAALEALQNLDARVAACKAAKDYKGMAEAYSAAARPKEAAVWYHKAKMRREEAAELSKAGQTVKAARLLMKDGDFEGAAKLYAEKGKHAQAAKALSKAGRLAEAAGAFAKAGKVKEAAAAYVSYFEDAKEDLERQMHAGEACFRLIQEEPGKSKVPAEDRAALAPKLASLFERAKRHDLAADLYRESGDMARAGEVYLLAGKLREAGQCMKQAGRTQEAAHIAGRFYESKEQWKEAGGAYAEGGDARRAGDCYIKAGEAVRAAECFEKAGDAYRAGAAYGRAGRFQDAIRLLQGVKEGEPYFDSARGLLGRCFYELHDYAHCVATLENHLTGRRVANDNVELHYMLALAYEQQGRLGHARELLYKIRTIDVSYRDVTDRITNLSSRISLQDDVNRSAAGDTRDVSGGGGIESVESSLGSRYQLQKELGRGGMGVVYLAKDTQLDRSVALKFLGTLVDDSEEYRQRFVREARAAARINHPNIVGIYDISASVGRAYIAMEYVDGASLYKHIRQKGKLAPREAVTIVGQSCAALKAIHDAGIVHRDIKPDNILLDKRGLVKLTDFGLAKAEDARMTQAGVVLGTPSYMSPEQVKGMDADLRSDIYSVGLVLHECLTGKTVFREGNVLDRQLNEMPPAPGDLVEGVPEPLNRLVIRCIEKDPDKRFQNVAELITELRAVKG
ncbi:MAG: protein kinase [bacterium]|nr:protein kinase [bacterium]